MSSLFHGKKSWNLKCNFKYGFSIVLCKKKKYFSIPRKKKCFSNFMSQGYIKICWLILKKTVDVDVSYTTQEMKFSIKDFSNKSD